MQAEGCEPRGVGGAETGGRARVGEDQTAAVPEVGLDHDAEARPPQSPRQTVEARPRQGPNRAVGTGGMVEVAGAEDDRLDVAGRQLKQRIFSHAARVHARRRTRARASHAPAATKWCFKA